MSEQDSNDLECPVTGFEFIVSIGVNGHDKEDAIKNLNEMMPHCPYYITTIAPDQYIEARMEEASKLMGEHTGNGQAYEYYKGRFLAFREILKPEIYGKDAKLTEKEEEEKKEEVDKE